MADEKQEYVVELSGDKPDPEAARAAAAQHLREKYGLADGAQLDLEVSAVSVRDDDDDDDDEDDGAADENGVSVERVVDPAKQEQLRKWDAEAQLLVEQHMHGILERARKQVRDWEMSRLSECRAELADMFKPLFESNNPLILNSASVTFDALASLGYHFANTKAIATEFPTKYSWFHFGRTDKPWTPSDIDMQRFWCILITNSIPSFYDIPIAIRPWDCMLDPYERSTFEKLVPPQVHDWLIDTAKMRLEQAEHMLANGKAHNIKPGVVGHLRSLASGTLPWGYKALRRPNVDNREGAAVALPGGQDPHYSLPVEEQDEFTRSLRWLLSPDEKVRERFYTLTETEYVMLRARARQSLDAVLGLPAEHQHTASGRAAIDHLRPIAEGKGLPAPILPPAAATASTPKNRTIG